MDKKKAARAIKLRVLLAVLGCAAMQACGKREEKIMTPSELRGAIDSCKQSGGSPAPIYDKANAMRVFRIDCRHRSAEEPK